MSILEGFVDWFRKSDQDIMEAHLKKDKEALQKALSEMDKERRRLSQYLHRLEKIIEKEEQLTGKKAEPPEKPTEKPEDFDKWLFLTEDQFNAIWEKKVEERSEADREFVSTELPRVLTEKNRLESHLHHLLEIMAKTRLLIDDLNEQMCRDLSGGHSIARVAQALVDRFGHELNEEYHLGRDDIRQYLEEHFGIDKNASRELFSLLEELRILNYRLKLPENVKENPLAYFAPDPELANTDTMEVAEALYGVWEIHA